MPGRSPNPNSKFTNDVKGTRSRVKDLTNNQQSIYYASDESFGDPSNNYAYCCIGYWPSITGIDVTCVALWTGSAWEQLTGGGGGGGGGTLTPTTLQAATYDASVGDLVMCDITSNVTINLPRASNGDQIGFYVYATGSGYVELVPDATSPADSILHNGTPLAYWYFAPDANWSGVVQYVGTFDGGSGGLWIPVGGSQLTSE